MPVSHDRIQLWLLVGITKVVLLLAVEGAAVGR
jgi:hypothetical protein